MSFKIGKRRTNLDLIYMGSALNIATAHLNQKLPHVNKCIEHRNNILSKRLVIAIAFFTKKRGDF